MKNGSGLWIIRIILYYWLIQVIRRESKRFQAVGGWSERWSLEVETLNAYQVSTVSTDGADGGCKSSMCGLVGTMVPLAK